MRLLFGGAIVILLIALLGKCAGAACLGSAGEVWAEHAHAHATWNYVGGQRCWHAGRPGRVPRQVRRPAYGMVTMPLPRPRPDWEILDPRAYPHLSAKDGRSLAEELLPDFEARWP